MGRTVIGGVQAVCTKLARPPYHPLERNCTQPSVKLHNVEEFILIRFCLLIKLHEFTFPPVKAFFVWSHSSPNYSLQSMKEFSTEQLIIGQNLLETFCFINSLLICCLISASNIVQYCGHVQWLKRFQGASLQELHEELTVVIQTNKSAVVFTFSLLICPPLWDSQQPTDAAWPADSMRAESSLTAVGLASLPWAVWSWVLTARHCPQQDGCPLSSTIRSSLLRFPYACPLSQVHNTVFCNWFGGKANKLLNPHT